ncbi:nucleoside kinase [Oceanotoga sp. DSM 15011]|jgi:uridine kinase|uniref:Uridine kinase n=1 Tax=Oceanotoga teriensis TaxID=515440 RepID=A0AA45HIH0_9BACT|nr:MULTISPECIES: nucleoside kinase [Oceanotoga]MDN5343118.1 uridine kinase [Oceanotoga sp.]PWJ91209.1 uridine kinase [Oceanotoga teriensis]UYO99684.1 nucleoside kinase [Oceanotoga sp. DSM 15011]
MKISLTDVNNGDIYEVEKGTSFYELKQEFEKHYNKKVYGVKINNNIKELFKKVEHSGNIKFLDLSDPDGVRIYRRGILFLIYMALKDINPNDKFYVNNSIGPGLYCEFDSGIPSQEYLDKIVERMKELVKKNLVFEKLTKDKQYVINLFKQDNQEDKANLFKYRKKSTVNFYKANGYFNYFYGYMPYSTGELEKFEIKKIENGFVMISPNESSPDKIPEYKHFAKLSATFNEYNEWLKIMDIRTVGDLNELIVGGKHNVCELIRISEALHEKKYSQIADEFIKRKNSKLLLIAGPSSSGKTTSAKRIAIQLKVNGLRPVQISLDDYFVDRSLTPRDENGNYDFESIFSLDLDLLNKTMKDLIEGKEVEIPKFNFINGKREWIGKKLKIEKDQPIIIEGIHGLNETLTSDIPRDQKFKVYVSALTQMNLDSVNRIPTTDTRIIRRIVRDFNSRGHNALDTLKMWASVRRGEERNIFPYQEEADIMFNSHLVYELSVLKLFAEPLLLNICADNEEYPEAKRLLRFLDYFMPITELEEIPRTSVIREFIGRSSFDY